MEERPIYSYIPPNLGDAAGLLGGRLDTRRTIEAIIGAGIAIGIYAFLSPLFSSKVFLYACIVLGALLAIICLVGVSGEPFSVFIFNIINYERRRVFVTLRPPMPDKLQKSEPEKPQVIESNIINTLRKNRTS